MRLAYSRNAGFGRSGAMLAAGVTLAAGQNEGMAFRFRDMLIAEAVDYVQPNVMITGGFTQTLRIAGMASAFSVAIANGGAGALQNMHLHAGLWNGGFCEWHLPFMGLCRHIYRDMPEAKGVSTAAQVPAVVHGGRLGSGGRSGRQEGEEEGEAQPHSRSV